MIPDEVELISLLAKGVNTIFGSGVVTLTLSKFDDSLTTLTPGGVFVVILVVACVKKYALKSSAKSKILFIVTARNAGKHRAVHSQQMEM